MSELVFSTVFRDLIRMFDDEAFSLMYFGRHLEKNLLILQYEMTAMTVFGDDLEWSAPELIKTVSFRGDTKKGVQIVGNENVILLLDEDGNLWRLINAFEPSNKKTESFHSLKEDGFYEWVPFNKFRFLKVLAITAMQTGFACLGLCGDSSRKLVFMSSLDSPLEDYTFEELNKTGSHPPSYFLTNLKMNIKNSIYKHILTSTSTSEEILLVNDRFEGKTYLCAKNGTNALVNVCDNYLISAIHLEEEKSFVLCFGNGKLVFCFYNEFRTQTVAFISKKLIFVEMCRSPDPCLLWSDGIHLNYTKLTFRCGEDAVKLSHLQLNCVIQTPVSLMKVNQQFIAVTMNDIYYYISIGVGEAKEIMKSPQELLSEICSASRLTQVLEEKTDLLAYYLQCKDVVQGNTSKGKMDMKLDGNCLIIKNCFDVTFREKFWKVQLTTTEDYKKFVRIIDLETDLNKEGTIMIEEPFDGRCDVKVSLIGEFDGQNLFLHLGVVNNQEYNETDELSEQLEEILKERNPYYLKRCEKEKEKN